MRIALDTNVLISAFATRGLSSDVLNLILSDHQLVLGETVLTELDRVLRTKLKVPDDAIQETKALAIVYLLHGCPYRSILIVWHRYSVFGSFGSLS